MLTTPNALALYAKLSKAPEGWIKSREGRRLTARALSTVRATEGREAAKSLRNLLTVASAFDRILTA